MWQTYCVIWLLLSLLLVLITDRGIYLNIIPLSNLPINGNLQRDITWNLNWEVQKEMMIYLRKLEKN